MSTGTEWHASMLDAYTFAPEDLPTLLAASRTVDTLEALHAAVERDGATLRDGSVHPAIKEARLQEAKFAKLIGALRIEDGTGLSQRRFGVRNQAA